MSTPTSAFSFQNFYSATLTSDITNSDLTIPLDIAPSITEGVLVIDPDTTNPEVIYFTSKGASSVTCPADGRGWDSTSAVSHLQGTTVICAPVAYYFTEIKRIATTSTAAWKPLGYAPNTVAYNGNRSYTLTFNSQDLTSYISNGMRVNATRTVSAPTQCTSLNGTTQYYSKTSPAGMTFTDDFVVSAWVKLTSYGADSSIASRYNGTSGWDFKVDSSGRLQLSGFNGGSSNNSYVQSYQSVPLNKWVHVAAQLDMSSFTNSSTTSYTMMDGVDVPATVARSGTNPTTLVQAGNLEIGSRNAGTNFWPGKIAQVAIYSAKVTQANIVATISQGLAGTETSLISAYSFSNSVNDLNANANNLSAQGSAVATNADSPFAQDDAAVPTGTTDYGIVQSCTFSTNTTMVVQVPEGNTIPTSGGVTSMQYSTEKTPFGFPSDRGRYDIIVSILSIVATSGTSTGTTYNPGSLGLVAPIGQWEIGAEVQFEINTNASSVDVYTGLSSSSSAFTTTENDLANRAILPVSGTNTYHFLFNRTKAYSFSAVTTFYVLMRTLNAINNMRIRGTTSTTIPESSVIRARLLNV